VTKRIHERGSDGIIVGSFTPAAAAEIAGRRLPLPRGSVGTLHSFAWRALDRPDLTVDRLADWNTSHRSLILSADGRANIDEMAPAEGVTSTDGDALLNEIDIMRARRVPAEKWPPRLQGFYKHWTAWKDNEGLYDFTDLIEQALANTAAAPGNPRVGYWDETQDFTPLELDLVRHWGRDMEQVVLAGDDDQVLYAFKGAAPDAFLDPPVPDEHKWILPQSYRVPRTVHAVATAWIERVSRREPKEYRPRDADGLVRRAGFSHDQPDALLADVERQVADGRTVMILTTCAYMLTAVKNGLRARGLPFHNPYRRVRGDWNPLAATRGVSAADRLLAYLILDERIFGDAAHGWTGQDVRRWSALIRKQGVFRRGAQAAIDGLPDRELSYAEVAALFEDERELEQAVEPSLLWFQTHLMSSVAKRMEFPITIAQRRSATTLVEVPRVVIGTIHSVKGGEADCVYLMPTMSRAGISEWQRPATRDRVIRQFYVGMTRAREELVICDSGHITYGADQGVTARALLGRA